MTAYWRPAGPYVMLVTTAGETMPGRQRESPGQPGLPGAPEEDEAWLARAVALAGRCSPSARAFSVGAVLVGAGGALLATGFSRETGPADHAEEVALARLAGGVPAGATMYSSLEPCAARASRPCPCAELIIAAGVRRVVIAWREPPLFVPGGGAAVLAAAGVTVTEIPALAEAARAPNAHLLGR
jgi:pyrimidine deaminase RibD-like protein